MALKKLYESPVFVEIPHDNYIFVASKQVEDVEGGDENEFIDDSFGGNWLG